jgi:glycosyltransferase involved in cell wall biosynthesis
VAGEMRILFITFASHTPSQSDYNHFQRVDFLSRRANLTVWARKGADFSASARPGTPIVHARLGGKLGLVLQVFAYSLIGRARGFDVVLTEPSLLSLAGLMCKAFGAGKWVVDVWDVPGRSGGERGQLARAWLRLNRYILKQGFKFADFFLLSIRPDYEFRYFNIPSARMLLMKNAIRVTAFQQARTHSDANERFDILCTRSSYHSDMGLDTMASAFELLRAAGHDVSLTIVGRIPKDLRHQVAALEGDPNVAFFDFLEKDRLKERIARSGVCVVPFRDVPDLAQTYPIKVLEYMASGKPVVVSKIGGMAEMIKDGETGLHFQAGDPADLAAKILSVKRDPQLAGRLGDNARRESMAFDYAVKGQKILDTLGALVAR